MPDSPKVFKPTNFGNKKLQDISGEYDRKRHREYNQDRRPEYHRFYGSVAWKKLRKFLKQQPAYQFCEICRSSGILTPVEHLDHIVPIAEAWDLRLEPKNIRPLCRKCHNKYGAKSTKTKASKVKDIIRYDAEDISLI